MTEKRLVSDQTMHLYAKILTRSERKISFMNVQRKLVLNLHSFGTKTFRLRMRKGEKTRLFDTVTLMNDSGWIKTPAPVSGLWGTVAVKKKSH